MYGVVVVGVWGGDVIILMSKVPQQRERVVGQARKTRGYLSKLSSGVLSIWQKRYFIIIQNTLSYFSDESLEEARKHITIDDIRHIKALDHTTFQLVTKKRIYELRADDEPTRDLWVASLNILINYKNWDQPEPPTTPKQLRTSSKKDIPAKRSSKNTKVNNKSLSPPKPDPALSPKRQEFAPEHFLHTVCLPRLAERWKEESLRNKVILMKEAGACYFILSCKSLLSSHEDEDLLVEDLIYPYDYHCLYFYQFGRTVNQEVVEICKCEDIEDVQEEDDNRIRLALPTRKITINLQKNREAAQTYSLVRKIKHAAEIGREYHNPLNIQIKRNIDPLLHRYDSRKSTVADIARKEVDKCLSEAREGQPRQQLRKNIENLKKCLKEIMNCCEAKGAARKDFKQEFVRQFLDAVHLYLEKQWPQLGKVSTLLQLKKILLLLYDFWKLVRMQLKDDRLFHSSVALQKILIDKYEEEIISKIDSCFSLSEEEILDEVNIEIKDEGVAEKMEKMETIFLSNNIFRQFHLDIRLVLYEFPEMPIHDKSLQYYLSLFNNIFRHLSERAFKQLDRWKNPNLLLGTCNEIEFIKNSLFEQMHEQLTKDYKSMSNKLKKDNLRQLQNEINTIEIMLVKKLFVITFTNIDRSLLNRPYDEMNIALICEEIILRLKKFTKINKYVKRNIFEASFEEICYFYYTNIIKFNKQSRQKDLPPDFFSRKITEDIKTIGQRFEGSIHNEKIYTHLKDLSLIKEFLQCDIPQIKKICHSLKKQFGNSFTETALKNLFHLREMNQELRENLINECSEIVKNSAETPEEISLISSSRESFLENWNNTRSRKSTLTLSLNEFYENQHMVHNNKYTCSKLKEGFLLKKKLSKTIISTEVKAYYKIRDGELLEYQSSPDQQPTNVYELQYVKKCYLHPDKAYIFVLQFPESKLQFKSQTIDESKEWIKNIYEQISSLSMMIKDKNVEKDRNSDFLCLDHKQFKDPSTMESYPKAKERSLENSGGTGSPKPNRKKQKEESAQSPEKSLASQQRQKQIAEDNCLKCSKGFFF